MPIKKPLVQERHRHRFELNNAYRDMFAEGGMLFSGVSPDKRLVEIVELKDHPFMLSTQFHPEFLSRPTRPHPLFMAFLKAVAERAGCDQQILSVEDGPTASTQCMPNFWMKIDYTNIWIFDLVVYKQSIPDKGI